MWSFFILIVSWLHLSEVFINDLFNFNFVFNVSSHLFGQVFQHISLSLSLSLSIYIYIYVCVCVCVCVCVRARACSICLFHMHVQNLFWQELWLLQHNFYLFKFPHRLKLGHLRKYMKCYIMQLKQRLPWLG